MMETKQRLIFLSLCKNSQDTLPDFLKSLELLRTSSKFDVYAIFGENGSKDQTRILLEKQAASDSWLKIINTEFMADIPNRLERMAAGREVLRRSLPSSQNDDVIVVFDSDLQLISELSDELIKKVLAELNQPSVFAVCANSMPVYYDILATIETYGGYNPAYALSAAKKEAEGPFSLIYNSLLRLTYLSQVLKSQRRIGTGTGLRFISAFNGICFYNRANFESVSYISTEAVCEHVVLNSGLHTKTGGYVYVSDFLSIQAPAEHTSPILTRIATFLFKKIRFKLINSFQRAQG